MEDNCSRVEAGSHGEMARKPSKGGMGIRHNRMELVTNCNKRQNKKQARFCGSFGMIPNLKNALMNKTINTFIAIPPSATAVSQARERSSWVSKKTAPPNKPIPPKKTKKTGIRIL